MICLAPDFPYNPASWTDAQRAEFLRERRRVNPERYARLRDAQGFIRWPRREPEEPWAAENFPEGLGKRERILKWLETEFGSRGRRHA